MPLFSEEKNEENKESIKRGLAQLAGLAAGTGAGYLAGMPIDARYQDRLLREGISLTRAKNQELEEWDTLFKLYNGKISMDDIEVGQRETYRKLLKKNTKDLAYFSRNPKEKRDALKYLDRGKVAPLFGENSKTPMRGLPMHVPLETLDPNKAVPLFGPVTSQMHPERVRSPYSKLLPAPLGIAGLMGAGKAYEYLRDKEPSRE